MSIHEDLTKAHPEVSGCPLAGSAKPIFSVMLVLTSVFLSYIPPTTPKVFSFDVADPTLISVIKNVQSARIIRKYLSNGIIGSQTWGKTVT